MHIGVACGAKRNEVPLRIVTGVAAEFLVVDLQIGHGAAALAWPAVRDIRALSPGESFPPPD
jgi:hypothetical protein